MPLHILDHPLAAHIMTHLRDATTKPATFRTLCYQLSLLLAIDATKDLPTEEKVIQTPLEPMAGAHARAVGGGADLAGGARNGAAVRGYVS
jgi:uracil phosphoribosyltransferase